jgi:hypothetical protein
LAASLSNTPVGIGVQHMLALPRAWYIASLPVILVDPLNNSYYNIAAQRVDPLGRRVLKRKSLE